MKRPRIDDLPAYASINDFAFASGLGRDYIRNRCNAGEIPGLRIGKQFRIDVKAALEQLSKEGSRQA